MIEHATCVIGAGAVGSSLALRLAHCGYPVHAVLSHTSDSSEAVAARIQGARVIDQIGDVPDLCRLFFLCVPDEEIARTASLLAESRESWHGSSAAHVSGVHTIDVLAPLADRGCETFGFHPIQTFPRRFDPDAFEGCYVGVEGSGEVAEFGRVLAAAIGAHPVSVMSEDKAAYHLAASVASNHLVALLLMIERLAATQEPESEWDLASFVPLIQRTLHNVGTYGAAASLTGPIVRGDATTVARHLAALKIHDQPSHNVYRALSRLLLEAASDCNRLAPDARKRLIKVLDGE